MRVFWFTIVLLLVLGVLTGIYENPSITGQAVAQLPPYWDYPTDDFNAKAVFLLDLNKAFFDPDGGPLSYSVRGTEGVAVGVRGSILIVNPSLPGDVYVTAADGTFTVVKKLRFS